MKFRAIWVLVQLIFRRLMAKVKGKDKKIVETILKIGQENWVKIDEMFGGKLSKDTYQDESGNWLSEESKAEYRFQRNMRRTTWYDLCEEVIDTIYPQYDSYTDILQTVLNYLGVLASDDPDKLYNLNELPI